MYKRSTKSFRKLPLLLLVVLLAQWLVPAQAAVMIEPMKSAAVHDHGAMQHELGDKQGSQMHDDCCSDQCDCGPLCTMGPCSAGYLPPSSLFVLSSTGFTQRLRQHRSLFISQIAASPYKPPTFS